MHFLTLQTLAAGLRQQELLREAEADRLHQLARSTGDAAPAGWRRLLGRGVRGLSFALGAASRRLDPTIDRPKHHGRLPYRA